MTHPTLISKIRTTLLTKLRKYYEYRNSILKELTEITKE